MLRSPAAIQQLLRQTPLVWRGYSTAEKTQAIATGFTALDRPLPGRSWPIGALTELALPRPSIGELRLLLPALCRIAKDDGRPVA